MTELSLSVGCSESAIPQSAAEGRPTGPMDPKTICASNFVTPTLSNLAAEITAFLSYEADLGSDVDVTAASEDSDSPVLEPVAKKERRQPLRVQTAQERKSHESKGRRLSSIQSPVSSPPPSRDPSAEEPIHIVLEGKIIFLESAVTFTGSWCYNQWNGKEKPHFSFVKTRNLDSLAYRSRIFFNYFGTSGSTEESKKESVDPRSELFGKWNGDFGILGRKTNVTESFELRDASDGAVEGNGSNIYGDFILKGSYDPVSQFLTLKKVYSSTTSSTSSTQHQSPTTAMEDEAEAKDDQEESRVSTRKRRPSQYYYWDPRDDSLSTSPVIARKGRGRPYSLSPRFLFSRKKRLRGGASSGVASGTRSATSSASSSAAAAAGISSNDGDYPTSRSFFHGSSAASSSSPGSLSASAPSSSSLKSFCQVCYQASALQSFLECFMCKVKVHPRCYNVSHVSPHSIWLCDICVANGASKMVDPFSVPSVLATLVGVSDDSSTIRLQFQDTVDSLFPLLVDEAAPPEGSSAGDSFSVLPSASLSSTPASPSPAASSSADAFLIPSATMSSSLSQLPMPSLATASSSSVISSAELSSSKSSGVECRICYRRGGALKATSDHYWVHVTCALLCRQVYFPSDHLNNPVGSQNRLCSDLCFSKIPEELFHAKCCLCSSTNGLVFSCSHWGCDNEFHIPCARDHSCLMNIFPTPEPNRYSSFMYCPFHSDYQRDRLYRGDYVYPACCLPKGIIYEGSVRDGKPNGNGTARFLDGSFYEGDWQNGIEHGWGVLCDSCNCVVYEGDFQLGIRHGRGTNYYKNGDIYEGEWKEGYRHGRGVYYGMNGSTYEGEWRNDRRNGRGDYTHQNYHYVGEWVDGIKEGHGVLTTPNRTKYNCTFHRGEIEGRGTCQYTDGSSYEGDFVSGLRDGFGVYRFPNGMHLEGLFNSDSFVTGKDALSQSQFSPQLQSQSPRS